MLSLDAPLVAVTWQFFFARLAKVPLRWDQPILLGMGVWVVYLADRWMEGWRVPAHRVLTQRHAFPIRRRWEVLGAGLGLAGLALALAIGCLPRVEWLACLVLVLPTAVYLFSHQGLHRKLAWRIPKEFCVALLFPLGPALAPWVNRLPSMEGIGLSGLYAAAWEGARTMGFEVCLFGVLCLANLSLISLWEAGVDEAHGQTSIALQLGGKRRWIRLLPWGIVMGCFGLWFGAGSRDRVSLECVGGSALLLGGLDWSESRIGREGARALADLTLLTPVFPLVLAFFPG
ncbi:MAG: hypothetical protein RLZZ244_1589 [Verrucomicrobiota bacterium]